MNLAQPKVIKVRIFNIEYTLRVEDEELAQRAVEYVNSLMNHLHDKMPEQSLLTIAILTALNIAEELFRERENKRYAENEIKNLLKSISEKFDSLLDT